MKQWIINAFMALGGTTIFGTILALARKKFRSAVPYIKYGIKIASVSEEVADDFKVFMKEVADVLKAIIDPKKGHKQIMKELDEATAAFREMIEEFAKAKGKYHNTDKPE